MYPLHKSLKVMHNFDKIRQYAFMTFRRGLFIEMEDHRYDFTNLLINGYRR